MVQASFMEMSIEKNLHGADSLEPAVLSGGAGSQEQDISLVPTISISENWVISLVISHLPTKVLQDGCKSAAEDRNCYDTVNRMDL